MKTDLQRFCLNDSVDWTDSFCVLYSFYKIFVTNFEIYNGSGSPYNYDSGSSGDCYLLFVCTDKSLGQFYFGYTGSDGFSDSIYVCFPLSVFYIPFPGDYGGNYSDSDTDSCIDYCIVCYTVYCSAYCTVDGCLFDNCLCDNAAGFYIVFL